MLYTRNDMANACYCSFMKVAKCIETHKMQRNAWKFKATQVQPHPLKSEPKCDTIMRAQFPFIGLRILLLTGTGAREWSGETRSAVSGSTSRAASRNAYYPLLAALLVPPTMHSLTPLPGWLNDISEICTHLLSKGEQRSNKKGQRKRKRPASKRHR